jgi:hypothetical protein
LREDAGLPKAKKRARAKTVAPKTTVPKVVVPKVVLTKRAESKGKEVKRMKMDTGSDDDCRGSMIRVDQGFGEMLESLAGDVAGIRESFVEVRRVRAVLEKMEGHMGDLVGLLKGKWNAGQVTETGTQTEVVETGTGTETGELVDVVMTGTEADTEAASSSAL